MSEPTGACDVPGAQRGRCEGPPAGGWSRRHDGDGRATSLNGRPGLRAGPRVFWRGAGGQSRFARALAPIRLADSERAGTLVTGHDCQCPSKSVRARVVGNGRAPARLQALPRVRRAQRPVLRLAHNAAVCTIAFCAAAPAPRLRTCGRTGPPSLLCGPRDLPCPPPGLPCRLS
jgi:hypothetical protein